MISAELTAGKMTKVITTSGSIVTGKLKEQFNVEDGAGEFTEVYQITIMDRDYEWTIDGSKIEAVAQW